MGKIKIISNVIHMLNGPLVLDGFERYKCSMSLRVNHKNITQQWDKVTCKNCLLRERDENGTR